ncbi:very short patch repair endonuclease [Nitratireductor sp.]|uniref:very short patch repair endonuclease n=1 Tax=Nitratireductor sp. TaxID=1872084 RepID=UPI00260ED7CF|nr:DNA mismatch endonuclease Vsr [Nitratireductor sp.]MCV0381743.1 DNA mismatch endonuclease Vsr [Nitratireductor sp.]
MVDTLSPEERSKRMSLIRSSDTTPELAIRRALHALGLRYRLNDKKLPGKPDLVFPRYKHALFVHGCFWHRHAGCKVATTPKSNTDFWLQKFQRNVDRDARVQAELRELGWTVQVVWECELKTPEQIQKVAISVHDVLKGIE